MRGTKISMHLIILERDLYIISRRIAKPREKSPVYAIFSDAKQNFRKYNEAALQTGRDEVTKCWWQLQDRV